MPALIAPPPGQAREYLARAASFDGYVEACGELGLDGASLLRGVGLDQAQLHDPDAMIPNRAYLRALDHAARAGAAPHFGLLLADKQSMSMMGPVGFLVGAAPDLATAIGELSAYIHLHNQAISLHLEVNGGLAIWSCESLDSDAPGHAQSEDHVLSVGFGLFRHFAGREANPDFVTLPHAAPPHPAHYRRRFGCPVEFAAERVQIVFDARLLTTQQPANDTRLHGVLDGYIKHLNGSAALPSDKRIQLVILNALKRGECSLRAVAAAMGLTPRSLQRRLAEGGSHFQAELDTVRSLLAQRYLRETQMSLTEISAILQYADLPAFSRAFKRVNGVAPQAWRAARQ